MGWLKLKMGMSSKQVGVMFVVAILAVAGTAFYFMNGIPQTQAATNTDNDGLVKTKDIYTPFALSGGLRMFVFNAEDKDATYGDADVYSKVWKPGTADWTGQYLTSTTTFDGTKGQINVSGDKLMTGSSYDVVIYQGDGGTNLYPETTTITIPLLDPEITSWSVPDSVFMYTEGSFSSSACTSTTGGEIGNESSNLIYLNKTAATVQGVLKWDCTLGQGTSGAVIREPVIIFRDMPGSELTDINDIESIYLSIKTGGSGLTIPTGNLVSEFLGGVPITIGPSDNHFRAGNDATLTVQISLPAAEANVGTGSFEMIFDDLGDYRAKADVFGTSDYDVHAAAEKTEFRICTAGCA